MNVSLRALSWLVVVILQVRQGSSYFEGLSGDSDVFKNPNCGSAGSCDCAAFYSKCVNTGCRQCKCLKKKRIYRSDVRKCLSDMEARDPWCRYQFLKTRADVIPTIDLSRPCAKNQCSQPITAPYDKTKSTCRLSWVNYLENGTWHESRVREFQEIFQLRSSDYFSKKGYMYSLEWKTSNDTRMPKRLFQVSLECVDQDNMKESYCLMFRAKGKNEPALASIPELERKTKSNPSRPTTKATQPATARRHRPTRSIRRRTNTRPPKIVVVSDNFAVILAAVAGAVGTALVIIPLALFFKRTARQTSGRNMSQHCDHHSHSLNGFSCYKKRVPNGV